MSSINLEDLSLQNDGEEEGFNFDFEEDGEEQCDLRWCLVGRVLSDRPIHVSSMMVRMADLWRPVKKVTIREAKPGVFLFQFGHPLDMEAVINGGPWTFDNYLLILEQIPLELQIESIPLQHMELWVQIHNLPTGLMKEKVGSTLANYIGKFVEYDKNNISSFWRQYMRVKVRMDVNQPLKKDAKVKNIVGEWCTVNFKYEKLGIFCFVCGVMGYTEKRCAVRYDMEIDNGERGWSGELRAELKRQGGRGWCIRGEHGQFILAGSNIRYEKLNITEGEALSIKEASSEFSFNSDPNNMILYNPSIGLKSKSSPKLKPSPNWTMPYNGFGYDHVNGKYKVLAVVENVDGDFRESLTKIYTFGEDSWRTIQDLPYTPTHTEDLGKYVSGTLNWVGTKLARYVIISFDLDKETYRDVLLPQNLGHGLCDYMCTPSLYVLNDCLC
ncbi:hypothetical protein TSUD_191440 [Trifolium subterraneum]|uniref:DUF4283 domain-containing protein n=1 Tax=Trifolium subterraneum TaxID=3900 RepID=A0A2Z6PGK6_TRISU|nr:hypothetical protein TSUD_191440 [Trifolium subterraneum]